MSEIWNLSALCRCCHVDGSFKSLELQYEYENSVEVYSVMLQETLGVSILKPPENLSYSICDSCIGKLHNAFNFKVQVTSCEQKFYEYLQNEEALNSREIKVEAELLQYNNELHRPDYKIINEVQNDSDNDNSGEIDILYNEDDLKSEDIKLDSDNDNSGEIDILYNEDDLKSEDIKLEYDSKKVIKKESCSKMKVKKSSTQKVRQAQQKKSQKASSPYICVDCAHEFDNIDEIFEHIKTHGKTRVKCRFCSKDYPLKKTIAEHENSVHIRQSNFLCDICNKKFSCKSNFRRHLLWHAGENKRFFCDTCGHGFNDRTNMRIHVDAVHLKLRKFPCARCDKSFTAKKHLKQHEACKHDGVKPHACARCPASYCDRRTLKLHELVPDGAQPKKSQKASSLQKGEKKTSDKRRHLCQECGVSFRTLAELKKHDRVTHKYRGPYICVDCAHEFDNIDEIFEHIKTHGKTRVKCRFCSKDYPLKKTIAEHENSVHIRQSIFVCDICNKKFSYKSTLRKHLSWHAGENKRFFCDTCGHGFNDRTNMRIHVDAVHLKLRKFPCARCDKSFTAKKHLKQHEACKHDGVKPHACARCPARYYDRRTLKLHELVHDGGTATQRDADVKRIIYQCKGCPEKFDNRGTFRAHVLKHNKEGTSPNICHICGRGFTCKYSLSRHVDNHSGIKPFACDICQKRFSQKALIQRHKRNVHDPIKKEKTKCPICKNNVRDLEKHQKGHDVRPFVCELCPRSYPQKNALNRHIKEFHFGIYKHACDFCNTKCRSAALLAQHRTKCREHLNTDISVGCGNALPLTSFTIEQK